MYVCCDKKSACITALGWENQAKGEGLRVEKAAVLWVAVEGVGGAEKGPGGRHHVAGQLGRRPRGDQQREADHGCSCTLQGIRENISNSAVCYSVHAVQLQHACFFHRKSVCRSSTSTSNWDFLNWKQNEFFCFGKPYVCFVSDIILWDKKRRWNWNFLKMYTMSTVTLYQHPLCQV